MIMKSKNKVYLKKPYKMKINQLILYFLILSIDVISIPAFSQIPSNNGGKERSDKNFRFMPVPYINYDRTLGFSGGLLPMAMYNLNKKDTISPSSLSGGFGMYTSNKSWFIMQFNKFYFKEDRYRAILVGGTGQFNSQFYLDLPIFQDFIGYGTAASFIMVEMQRMIIPHLYAGINYKHAKLYTELDFTDLINETVYLDGIGAIISYDLRDNVYYPMQGILGNLKYSTYPEFLGNAYASNKIKLDYNHFFKLKNEHDVIGARFFGGLGLGDLSFNQLFVVGNNDIRGYTQGKYRGKQIIAMQGEYRWNPFKKIGFVGFAGIATVFNSINNSDNGKLLPAVGTGFRYNVFPKNHMNVGMDIAAGIDDWGIYFKIGEAF